MDHPRPIDVSAECATLGAVLLDAEAITALSWLSPADFALEKHAIIFATMQECARQGIPPDLSIVASLLRQNHQLEAVGGIAYLGELSSMVPTAVYVQHYARTVKRTAVLRRLIETGGKITSLGYATEQGLDQTLEQARQLLSDVEQAANHHTRAPAAPIPLHDLLQQHFPPLRWIIPDLLPEGLSFLGGKPKMGKSWLALAMALAVAGGGCVLGNITVEQGDVLYMGLEDTPRRMQARSRKLLGDSPAPTTMEVIFDCPRLNRGGLTLIETWLKKHPHARLVVVDTLAKVRPESRWNVSFQEDYDHLQGLKDLADRYQVAILVVHHLRKAEGDDPLDLFNGTMGQMGGVDGALVLKRERGQADAVLQVVHRDGENDKDIALKWDAHTATWISMGDATAYRLSQEQQAILTFLAELGRPAGPKEVADGIGQPEKYNNIVQLMYRMSRDGALRLVNRGVYAPSETPSHDHDREHDRNICPDHVQHGFPVPQTQEHDQHDRHDPRLTQESEKNTDHVDHVDHVGDFRASQSVIDHDREHDRNICPDHVSPAEYDPAFRAIPYRPNVNDRLRWRKDQLERARHLLREVGTPAELATDLQSMPDAQLARWITAFEQRKEGLAREQRNDGEQTTMSVLE